MSRVSPFIENFGTMDPSLFRRRAEAHHVHARQDDNYRGGWPLGYMGPQCPTDTPVVCKRDTDKEPQGCCPQGQFCITTLSEVYCCPTEADCGTAVRNRPVCANPAWTLFGLTSNRYFCCPSAYFGVKSVELSGRGVCEPNLDGFPATRIASTITRGVPAPTGTATGTGSRRTSSPGGTPESTGTTSDSNSASGGSGGGSVSVGVIAGSVVGGVVALLLGIALLLWLHRRSLRRAPGPAPAPAPAPAHAPEAEPKWHPSPLPQQPSPSAGMIHQHHHQHPNQPQFGSPAVPTPPPQYGSPHPPEAYGNERFEMPVHAQELASSTGPTFRS